MATKKKQPKVKPEIPIPNPPDLEVPGPAIPSTLPPGGTPV